MASRRSTGLRVLGRSLRFRLGSTVVLFVVAVVAVAGAAVGPALLRSDADSVLAASLAAGGRGGQSAETVTASGGPKALARLRAASALADRVRPRVLQPPLVTVESGVDAFLRGQQFSSTLLARTAICAHIRIVAGSCPTATGTVAVSARSARLWRARLGDTVAVTAPHAAAGQGGRMGVRVVGIYVAPRSVADPYWEDRLEFDFGATPPKGQPPPVDPLVATDATVFASGKVGAQVGLTADRNIAPGTLRASQAARFSSELGTYQQAVAGRFALSATSGLTGILAAFGRDRHQIDTVVAIFAVELAVLGLLVLYALVAAAAPDRRLDVDLAERRGFTRAGVLRVATGDAVVVLLLAFPAGLALAWAAVASASAAFFVPGTPSGLDAIAVAAGVASLVGGVAAAVAGSRRILGPRRRASAGRGDTRAGVAALDGIAVALAAAGLVALTSSDALSGTATGPIAVVAPAMVAVGASVVVLRLVELGLRVLVRVTAESRSVGAFLALRAATRRRPSALRQILPLCAAVASVTFAVLAFSVVSANRLHVAHFETGASRVDVVSVPAGVNLEDAVRRADPSGREAMAAEVEAGSSSTLLAVDPSRLASVAAWPRGLDRGGAPAIASYLSPPTRAPLLLHGSAMRVTATLPAGSPSVELGASLFDDAAGSVVSLTVGTLRPGTHAYTVGLLGSCPQSCELRQLSPTIPSSGRLPARFVLRLDGISDRTGTGQWRAARLEGAVSGAWSATPSVIRVVPGASGVTFVLPTGAVSGLGVSLAPADVPGEIPAVVTAGEAPPVGTPLTVTGVDGNYLAVRAGRVVPDLPAVGGDAVLVSLTFAQRVAVSPPQATLEVWLSRSATPALTARLARLGVHVVRTETTAGRLVQLDRDPLGSAYRFVVAAGAVAALLAVGAALFVEVVSARRRRGDLEALRVAGVPGACAVRAGLLESGLVLAVSVVVGTLVGVLTASLALRSLPELTAGNDGVPLGRSLPAAPVLFAVAGLVSVSVLVIAAGGRAARSCRPPRTGTPSREGRQERAATAAVGGGRS